MPEVEIIERLTRVEESTKSAHPGLVGNPSEWIQTSYNTRGGIHYQPDSDIPSEDQIKSLRKNYAGIGYTYDPVRDAFIPQKPSDQYILNEETCLWELPTSEVLKEVI